LSWRSIGVSENLQLVQGGAVRTGFATRATGAT
jgi:hypothetical protein